MPPCSAAVLNGILRIPPFVPSRPDRHRVRIIQQTSQPAPQRRLSLTALNKHQLLSFLGRLISPPCFRTFDNPYRQFSTQGLFFSSGIVGTTFSGAGNCCRRCFFFADIFFDLCNPTAAIDPRKTAFERIDLLLRRLFRSQRKQYRF